MKQSNGGYPSLQTRILLLQGSTPVRKTVKQVEKRHVTTKNFLYCLSLILSFFSCPTSTMETHIIRYNERLRLKGRGGREVYPSAL